MPSKTGCTSPILGISIVPTCTIGVGAYGSDGAGSGCGSLYVVVVALRVVVVIVGGDVVGAATRGESSPFASLPRVTNAVVSAAAMTMPRTLSNAIQRRRFTVPTPRQRRRP